MAWGRVDDTYYDHPKLDHVEALHGPLMRLAVAGLNALAWSYCNRFLTDGLLTSRAIAKIGALPEVLAAIVECELWDEVPGGAYQVHDFLDHNDSRGVILDRRAKEAKRKADWRASRGKNRGPAGTDDDDEHDVPSGHALRPGVSPAGSPNGTGRGTRAGAQGAPEATPSANPVPTRPDPSRPVPTRPDRESLQRGSRAGERADIAALHDRGWKRVTTKQRAVLDEVAARHDATGHAFAAESIRLAPDGTDPLEAVMAADRLWQESQRRRLDAEEAAHAEEKRREQLEAHADRAALPNAGLERISTADPPWAREPVEAER